MSGVCHIQGFPVRGNAVWPLGWSKQFKRSSAKAPGGVLLWMFGIRVNPFVQDFKCLSGIAVRKECFG